MEKTNLPSNTQVMGLCSLQTRELYQNKAIIPIALLIIGMLVTGGILFHFNINAIVAFALMGVGSFGVIMSLTAVAISSLLQRKNLPPPQKDLSDKKNTLPSIEEDDKKEEMRAQESTDPSPQTSPLRKPTPPVQQTGATPPFLPQSTPGTPQELSKENTEVSSENQESDTEQEADNEEFVAPGTTESSLQNTPVISSNHSRQHSGLKEEIIILPPSSLPSQEENELKNNEAPLVVEESFVQQAASQDSPDPETIKKKLEKLYGKKTFPTNLEPKIMGLLLLSHEAFLALSLEEMDSFSPEEMHYAYERLTYLESHSFTLNPRVQETSHLTLGSFRKLKPEELSSHDIPERCLGMLSNTQIKAIKREKYTALREKIFTNSVIANMDIKTIQRVSLLLSLDHVALFSEDLLKNPEFPWQEFIKKNSVNQFLTDIYTKLDKARFVNIQNFIPWASLIKKNRDEVHNWFSIVGPGRDRTILSSFTLASIKILSSVLHPYCLSLFSEEILQDKDFPWNVFGKHIHFGANLRSFSPQQIIEHQENLPWKAFNKRQVDDLFSLSHLPSPAPSKSGGILSKQDTSLQEKRAKKQEANSNFAKELLPHLNWVAIEACAPYLPKEYFPLFGDKLQDQKFPWHVVRNRKQVEEFLKKSK